MLAMLRALLADRFQLQVHRELKEGNVYALVAPIIGLRLEDDPRTGSCAR
jgi:uncharacterized protein (TIGR03435 family)